MFCFLELGPSPVVILYIYYTQQGFPLNGPRQFLSDKALICLRLEECEQVLVDPVLESRAHAVRRALVHLERRVLDDLGREQG